MNLKKKGIISLIITFVLLFSGICLESVKADSIFREPSNVIDMTTVNIFSEKLLDENVCATHDITGRKSSEIFRNIRSSDNKRELREFRYILFTECLNNYISISDIVNERCVTLPEYHSISILTFIHNKDGKK